MKKWLLLGFVATLMSVVLVGCGSSEGDKVSGEGEAQVEGKPYRVAYIARAQADSFAAWLANAVQEESDKYDNIDIDIFDGQASDDTENYYLVYEYGRRENKIKMIKYN